MLIAPAHAAASPRLPVILGMNSADLASHPATALQTFAEEAGADAKIAMYYQDWYPKWSTALLDPKIVGPIYASGAVPMISWTPLRSSRDLRRQPAYRLRQITAGVFDPYLRRAAAEAAALGRPVLINLAPEMNGGWFNYGAGINGNTPEQFKAMWRHVVRLFRRAGATNVRWVWSPNVYGNNRVHPFGPYYPGDDWVDVVGLDGYNWGKSRKTAWETFDDIFQNSYSIMSKLTTKPMIISETGSAERGGNKASWVGAIARALQTRMPRIQAIIWFDRAKERNWKIDSSPGAQSAFRRLVSSPPFGGRVASLLGKSPSSP